MRTEAEDYGGVVVVVVAAAELLAKAKIED